MIEADTPLNLHAVAPNVLTTDKQRAKINIQDLGLAAKDLSDHIGWDIGALRLTELLSNHFDGPAVCAHYSRLFVDCNRPLEASSVIPEWSDKRKIPGNIAISDDERRVRLEMVYDPFHKALKGLLKLREESGQRSIFVGVHSFTPVLNGEKRPWKAGLMWEGSSRFAEALFGSLQAQLGSSLGLNDPYRASREVSYTMHIHAASLNREHVQIEVRQDLLTSQGDINSWAILLIKHMEIASSTTQAP